MPSPEFLDELAHELKDQFASNADLRNESELFYEFQGRASRSTRNWTPASSRPTTIPSAATPEPLSDRSPLARNVCRKVKMIQNDLARIQPGWFHVGSQARRPERRLLRRKVRKLLRLGRPEGRDQLTEFTLTVLKITSLIKETQTLINPGSVKFSPGDRGG